MITEEHKKLFSPSLSSSLRPETWPALSTRDQKKSRYGDSEVPTLAPSG